MTGEAKAALLAGLAHGRVRRQASPPDFTGQDHGHNVRVAHAWASALDFRHFGIVSRIVATLNQ